MKKLFLPCVVIAFLGAGAFLVTPQRTLQAHCQVPCGIYDDHGRIRGMLEIPIDVFYQTGPAPEGLWLPDQGVAPYRGRG